MRTDPFVRENLEAGGMAADQLPRSWFGASVVHLAGSRESDVVLIGKGPLEGANVTQYWVLRPTSHGWEVLLQATALGLSVKNRRLNGYRDIETAATTSAQVTTVSFRFDGHRYQPYTQSTKSIQ
ncbi:MAG: hypothetical protein WDO73_20900 [Ignavibacteriota bacterium]